jgi:crotonobetainyl-CoA:carnitine CoA-transferase CaiB-like acyl-CoA transferase
MLDTQVAWLSIQAMNYLVGGSNPARLGNGHPNIVPYQVFETADGHIMLTIGNDTQFQRFCDFAGVSALAADERFATNAGRVRNRDALIPQMRPVLAAKPSSYWLENLERLSIGCGPINTVDQVFADPQVKDRGMAIEMPHAALGGAPVPLVASPLRFSETPVTYRQAPPVLGEHTDAVLRDVLGMEDGEIDALRRAGAI